MIQEEKKINDGSVQWRIKNLGNSLINHRVYNPSLTDFNNFINEGFYPIRGASTNSPTGRGLYGNLIVLNTDYDRNVTGSYIKQILLTHDRIFIRSCHDTTWSTWKQLTFDNQAITASSLSNPGYVKFGNGLIIQWGHEIQITFNNNRWQCNLPIAFPNDIWTVNISSYNSLPLMLSQNGNNPSAFSFTVHNGTSYILSGTININYIAIGY